MSFLTGTSAEVLTSPVATGTQLNTFTTEASLMGGLPTCMIPAGFFFNAGAAGKCLKLKALFRIGSTGTPTFTWTLRLLTSTTWSAGGVAWSSAAITVGSGVTLAPVELDFELVCRSVGAGGGANTVLAGIGSLRAGTAFAAGGGVYSVPNANTGFTNSIDSTVTQYLFLSAACGTSSASNLIQLEMMKFYGEN